MQKIELIIEGRPVRARSGATILEAAAEVGVEVPRLCRLEGRKSRAVCRICSVGVEGRPGLVSACSTPARPGMVVDVFGPRPSARRRVIMEFVLAEHGEHSGGMCEVEHLAQELGVSSSRFEPQARAPNPGGSEYLVVESEACIRCDRCMEACERGVITRLGRGRGVYLAFDEGRSVGTSSCVACGDCVAVCPAGGLRLASIE